MKKISIAKISMALAISTAAIAVYPISANTIAQDDWISSYSETEQGSFTMGNPDAPVKLVEYASYTCGHCATFEADDAPRLKSEKIAGGIVSFEIRSLIRDPLDLTMAMLARCGGKEKFFGNHKFLMANQRAISTRTNMVSQPSIEKLENGDFTGFMTDIYGEMKLGEFMQQRGINDEQAKACLTDKAALDKLLATTDAAGPTYGINATPSFVINGKTAENAHSYDSLKPLLAAQSNSK